MRLVVCALTAALLTVPANAETARIDSRDTFLSLVSGKALTRLGITLNVSPDGRISGRAFGQPVKGDWKWQGGFFCRTLYFGDQNLGDNCQTVEQRGQTLRFTADRGAGDHADLRLR